MRHIDHRRALGLHPRQQGEQPLDLARFQRRGRLIENKELAAPAQRLGDGNELALGEAQSIDTGIGVRRKFELGERGPRLFPHGVAINGRNAKPAAHRRVVQRQVFGNRQGRDESQLLRNGGNARRDGIVRAAEVIGLAINRDLALIGPVHAAQNPRQRRFAGAVLADQGVDLARHHVEIDTIERARRAELLGDAARAGRRSIHLRRNVSAPPA